jgi:hypothetical protein
MSEFHNKWKWLLSEVTRVKREVHLKRRLKEWQKMGAVPPMAHLGKRNVVERYMKNSSLKVFVETGTYKGDMIYGALPYFNDIYSIELNKMLCSRARKKFIGYRNVHILQGQSGEVLPKILNNIDEPCLFWLDAHYSGGSTSKGDLETPIMQEMQCILYHPKATEHVILIDDARCFTGENDYPTMEGLESFIRNIYPDWVFEVKDDIIRTHADIGHIHEPE